MKVIKLIVKILAWLIFCFSVFIFCSVWWLLSVWTNLTMEELLYHLSAPLEGTGKNVVSDYLLHYGLIELIVVVVIALILIILKKKHVRTRWFYAGILLIAISLLAGAFVRFNKRMGLVEYLQTNYLPSQFIEDNYVDPAEAVITFPEQKRNLIYIYLESMEVTYTSCENGGAFYQNIIPELVDLAHEGEDFSGPEPYINGGASLKGAGFTMGAMFAQSAGLPLKAEGVNANYISSQDSIYPLATCIGDILEDAGYTNEIMFGSNAQFGGRKAFYQGHGNYKINDYNYALETGLIPPDYYVFWGYEDEKLFGFAKDELLELSSKSQPFNFTMLTVDTHFEDGYVCELCGSEYYDGDQYSNVMACSSKQVGDFVDWIKQQDFYENTTIIICGDHPTMDGDFCADVSPDYTRKVFTTILNAPISPVREDYRSYSTMDMFPTTLAALGAEIDGDQLGMGVNLYSDKDTIIEKYGIEYCNTEMGKKSELMDTLGAIKINDNLAQTIGFEADVDLKDVEGGLEIDFRAYAHFAHVKGFKKLIAEITWNETDEPISVVIDSYNSTEDYYYNSSPVEDCTSDEVIVTIFMIDDEGNKYEIKTYYGE